MKRGLVIAALLGGCADDEAMGMLDVRIYGEAFIEEGIPSSVFDDGWAIEFSKYLVAIDHVNAERVQDGGRYVFDLHQATGGEGREVTSLAVPSGDQLLGFRIGPGGAATAGNATESDQAMMTAMGLALFVEGVATKDGTDVAFAWGFESDTTYHDCEVADGVSVDDFSTTTITIHADHIFYDDLESTMPNTSFDLVADSDADMDGTVTADELRARDISTEARYQVGSTGITNLWDYMTALSKTVGHIDGEGECES
jgi:hypothetical protein